MANSIKLSQEQEVSTKAALLFYVEEGALKSVAMNLPLEREADFVEEINQVTGEVGVTKEFILELIGRYGIKK